MGWHQMNRKKRWQRERYIRNMIFHFATLAVALSLSACGIDQRLAQVNQLPEMSDIANPVEKPGYRPVRLPMPNAEMPTNMSNSLWRGGSRAFFKDQRAAKIGDLLTVQIEIADKASVDNTTTRSRKNEEKANLTNIFGFEGSLGKVLPDGIDPSSVLDVGSTTDTEGKGSVARSEKISLTVAAIITQILPNGNLVIHGRQEIRINYEIRELMVDGVIRPEDIGSDNTIDQTQIAEARIIYGGRGQISDLQQPRYGQQIIDIIYPF